MKTGSTVPRGERNREIRRITDGRFSRSAVRVSACRWKEKSSKRRADQRARARARWKVGGGHLLTSAHNALEPNRFSPTRLPRRSPILTPAFPTISRAPTIVTRPNIIGYPLRVDGAFALVDAEVDGVGDDAGGAHAPHEGHAGSWPRPRRR